MQTSWNNTYYAADGSNIKYIEDSLNGVYRLQMPDGSFYDFEAAWGNPMRKAVRFTDRNGNYLAYNSGVVTDTMGRNFTAPFGLQAPPSETTQPYTLPGMTGSYSFTWKKLEYSLTQYQSLKYRGPHWQEGANGDWEMRLAETHLFNSAEDHSSYVLSGNDVFNPIVLTEIALPNGQKYQFSYDIFGRIDRVKYPTGGEELFTYAVIPQFAYAAPNNVYDQANHGVWTRRVFETPGGTDSMWTYSAAWVQSPVGYKVTTVAPDNTMTERIMHRGSECPGCSVGSFGFENILSGMPYEESSYDSDNPRKLLSKTLTTWTSSVISALGAWHPRVTRVDTTVYDPATNAALSSSVTTDYAGNPLLITTALNPKTVAQHGYTATLGALGPLERVTDTTYIDAQRYIDRNLRSLPSIVLIKDAGNNIKAKTQIFYDELEYAPGETSPRWANPDPAPPAPRSRGLVTQTQTWHSFPDQYVETQDKYDLMGNLRSSRDGRGNWTETAYSAAYDYAYPTSFTTPAPQDGPNYQYGSTTGLITSTVYDFNTGLPTFATDANGQQTSMLYVDALLRPTKITAPNTHETITEYGLGTDPSSRWVKSRSKIDASTWKESFTWFDGLGRTVKSQSVDDDGVVFVLTCYDKMGRVSKVTNPFRENTPNNPCTTANGLEWTTNTYDSAGRLWKVTTPDGAEVKTTYSLATAGSAIGTAVTVEDQAGKQRRSITNALGQLVRVDEPVGSGTNLGSINAPTQPTTYTYDPLNNLTEVSQPGDSTTACGALGGMQVRKFNYDAMSRLKSACNPESGTINYTYDANSNLFTKIDARGVKTTYIYDRLNRVYKREYSLLTPGSTPPNYQPSPNVTYHYDNLTYAKGKLIKVASGTGADVSTTEYTSFDNMGRVTASKQTTDGVTYGNGSTDCAMTYDYNLAGVLIEQQYPSCRKVKSMLDPSGDIERVQSRKAGATGFLSYAHAFSYTAAGAVSSKRLGNGLWEWTTFNNRLQPETIALATVFQEGIPDRLWLKFTYKTDHWATDNNGNVLTQTITQPFVTHPFVQTYTYDELNRLKTAGETSNNSPTWSQVFGYDRFGNREITSGVGGADLSFVGNKITSHTYDAAGNTTVGMGRTFTYDSENKQTHVDNGTTGGYWYDGDGRRVKKERMAWNGMPEVTVFVYDVFGKLVAEYQTNVEPPAEPKVAFLTNDHLGTPRINTDQTGAVSARHDYLPFGEEITYQLLPQRGAYSIADNIRKQFTGYERDIESGLDFAQARMYASRLGRFSVPDPENIGADTEDPQSWNGYAYVVNSPLNLIDPDGLAYFRKDGILYWLDDKFVTDRLKDPKKNGGYEFLPYGTEVTVAKDEKGEFYAFAGERVILREGRKLDPVRKSRWEESLLQTMLRHGEDRTLWFWRPVIYTVGTAEMAVLSVATAAGAGASVGASSTSITARTAATPFGRSIASLKQAIQSGSGAWQRVSAHAEKAVGRAYPNATSIEEVFVNVATGERIVRHVIVRGSEVLHQTFRTHGKHGR